MISEKFYLKNHEFIDDEIALFFDSKREFYILRDRELAILFQMIVSDE